MENNDFDIFDLVKILIKKKTLLLLLTVLFFLGSFIYLRLSPTFYRASYILSSTVLTQDEITLKNKQLIYLLENKSYANLSKALGVEGEVAKSIEYITTNTFKDNKHMVELGISTANEEFANNFHLSLENYFKNDSFLVKKEELYKKQLNYSLEKYSNELDSVANFKKIEGITIHNNETSLIDLVNSKNKIEESLAFHKLLKIHDGYAVVKTQSSNLINIISALMFAIFASVFTTLFVHFFTLIYTRLK